MNSSARQRGEDLAPRRRLGQRVRLHVRGERADLALAGLLRPVHGDVGVAHQAVGVEPGPRAGGGDPDRGADPARLAGDRHGLGEQAHDPVRDLLAVRGVGVLEQHGELVAAEPRREIGRPDAAADPLGRRDQHGVARGMARVVVDPLEVVEVEEEHRARPARPRERLVHAAHEQRAVREVGQRVAVRLALQRALQLAHPPDRLLEPVELERHARVARERLEQPQVGGAEPGAGAEPLAEEHHADQARLPRHRRDRRAAHLVLLEVRGQRGRRRDPRHHGRVLVARDTPAARSPARAAPTASTASRRRRPATSAAARRPRRRRG